MTQYQSLDYYATREYIGRVLAAYRNAEGYSLRELAVMCGYSPNTIKNIEEGRFTARTDIIDKIASKLGARITLGALPDDVKRLFTRLESLLIVTVRNWVCDNWRMRPAENDYLLHACRHNDSEVNQLMTAIEDAIGEVETDVLATYIVDYAVKLSEA